ncbi:hypothetical protein CDR19_25700 [Ectopseudomonas toyotomiensis]|uniref:Phage Mu protein F like protein n=1 Tax=Ectopseudomonas toyotomiensis TaxID=554344 RepID=A0A1I5Z420_9GAMM|nr:phage minor head protein [Pseudomonas toyotomiensis]PIA65976.1 hypothetical protein CDR19_25700 [Pseudomonas toyotomiensis]SFQ51236.1 Phage Mu protein F like protein [Pseudomonas toyotomiensis]
MATAASYGSLSFREQIDFMRAKQPVVDYWRVQGAAHDQSFVSAGAHRVDLVADLHAIINRAISDGTTLQDFREDYFAVLDNYGWEPDGGREWRARVIYETNLRTSYAAGRYAQLQAVKAERPFWVYNHSDAVETPRELHLLWNGLAIHADNPWWQLHYPPNGWGCCCFVTAYSLEELQRYLGKSGPDEPPASNVRGIVFKGQVVQVPEGIDPGWGYAPGRSVFEQQVQGALEKTTRLPAEPAARMNEQLLQRPAVTVALRDDWSKLLDVASRATGPVVDRQLVVGSLAPAATEAALALVELQSPLVRAGTAFARSVLQDAAASVTRATLTRLPIILARPAAVLLDPLQQLLLYVASTGGSAQREVVRVAVASTGPSVVGAAMVNTADLAGDIAAGTLQLLEGSL